MMQNRLKDHDRGGYTSDRYRPHDNYTNAFNMLAQIGLAEKEVTNSMRNAVTQAANVKALQDRLKFDVSSYSAKLKQSALDYSAGQQMKYEDLIQTYMDSNADKRKEKIKTWAKENEEKYVDDAAFKEAFNEYKEKVYKMDIDTAKEKYKEISDIIKSHSEDTQKYIEEFDNANVFSFYTNDSVENNQDNKSSVWKSIGSSIGSSIIKTNAIIGKFFTNLFSKGDKAILDSIDSHSNEDNQDNHYDDSAFIKAFNAHKEKVNKIDMDTAKKKYKTILDSIESYSDDTQKYIKKFDNTDMFSFHPNNPINTNAIIEKFFKGGKW